MRKKRLFKKLIMVLVVLPILLAGSADAKWWDKLGKPEYGGTIILRSPSIPSVFDNYTYFGAGNQFWFERLWTNDWALDREIWPFAVDFTPAKYIQGLLAESWDIPDAQTIIANIRKDVNWQDKPPVNGRKFTAHDVEYHYHRMLGTGSGFTKGSPFYATFVTNIESITAIDDYTVEFKYKEPSALGFYTILDPFALNVFEARESLELEPEGLKEWKNAVGTGPWILSSFVDGTSMTFDRNPNYWGRDERHPENQLPYADQLKILCIPDAATALSALRTGKLTMMNQVDWRAADSMAKSNPDLKQAKFTANCPDLEFRCDLKPFTDINVRKALQLAIDRKALAESYYGGTVEAKACGLVNPAIQGYCFDYDVWPQSLKDEYSYNPEKAKQMLAKAGYPDGFKTNVVAAGSMDMQLLQALKAYLMDVGVDMEIQAMEYSAFRAHLSGGLQDQMIFFSTGDPFPPNNTLWKRSTKSGSGNYTYNNDPAYDAMLAGIEASTDPEKMRQLMVEADRYAIEHHWDIATIPFCNYNIWQPCLRGYSNESAGAGWGMAALWARLWIDQEMHKSMGH